MPVQDLEWERLLQAESLERRRGGGERRTPSEGRGMARQTPPARSRLSRQETRRSFSGNLPPDAFSMDSNEMDDLSLDAPLEELQALQAAAAEGKTAPPPDPVPAPPLTRRMTSAVATLHVGDAIDHGGSSRKGRIPHIAPPVPSSRLEQLLSAEFSGGAPGGSAHPAHADASGTSHGPKGAAHLPLDLEPSLPVDLSQGHPLLSRDPLPPLGTPPPLATPRAERKVRFLPGELHAPPLEAEPVPVKLPKARLGTARASQELDLLLPGEDAPRLDAASPEKETAFISNTSATSAPAVPAVSPEELATDQARPHPLSQRGVQHRLRGDLEVTLPLCTPASVRLEGLNEQRNGVHRLELSLTGPLVMELGLAEVSFFLDGYIQFPDIRLSEPDALRLRLQEVYRWFLGARLARLASKVQSLTLELSRLGQRLQSQLSALATAIDQARSAGGPLLWKERLVDHRGLRGFHDPSDFDLVEEALSRFKELLRAEFGRLEPGFDRSFLADILRRLAALRWARTSEDAAKGVANLSAFVERRLEDARERLDLLVQSYGSPGPALP